MSPSPVSPAAALRRLPAVHVLVEHPLVAPLAERAGREQTVAAARGVLDDARAALLAAAQSSTSAEDTGPASAGATESASTSNGRATDTGRTTENSRTTDSGRATDDVAAAATATGDDALAAAVRDRLAGWLKPRPTRVINATGVILHTNLGRAPVSEATAAAMAVAAAGYSDLEYELDAGERGSRHDLLVDRLRRLTGAEAALVVNNNAGATMLVLSALAKGRGVIVSRGQLVEIGGGYRIPDVMEAGGARLVEVGTTNRTHGRDYEQAIDEDVALLLRVHTSNYRMIGFTHEVPLEEMVAIGARHGLPVVDDLGSGSLLRTEDHGLAAEPLVQDSIAAGADLVTFSGDKLLGGPQAGLIVGRAAAVETLRRHPLTRALRPDKSTLAGLAATLDHYLRGEALSRVPVWRMIAARPDTLGRRAEAWRAAVRDALGADAPAMTIDDAMSAAGGGSLPGEALPTRVLRVAVAHADAAAAALRRADPPVVCRVADGMLVLDPRTVAPGTAHGVTVSDDAANAAEHEAGVDSEHGGDLATKPMSESAAPVVPGALGAGLGGEDEALVRALIGLLRGDVSR